MRSAACCAAAPATARSSRRCSRRPIGEVVDAARRSGGRAPSAAASRGSSGARRCSGAERFGADALPAVAAPAGCAWSAPRMRTRVPLGDLRAAARALARHRRRAHRRRRAAQQLRDLSRTARPAGARRRHGRASAARRCWRSSATRRRIAGDRRSELPIRYTRWPRTTRPPPRSPPLPAARRCTRAIPTTCCAAAASSRAMSTSRSPPRRTSSRARRFTTSYVEHAYIEPEAGYAEVVDAAMRGARRGAACASSPARRRPTWTATRSRAYSALRDEQVHIVPSAIGGGFGGKLDLVGAAAARRRGLEAEPAGAPRLHAAGVDAVDHQAAPGARCRRASRATRKAGSSPSTFSGDFNTGAYASWGPTVANRVPIHASGPYCVPNVRALTRAVLTNDAIAGAFRGFGVPQSTVLDELLLDELADERGIDRSSSARSTRSRAGEATATGQTLERELSACAECLERLRPAWRAARAARGAIQRARPAQHGSRDATARRRHRLHVVRHRQHRDRQSVDDARRAALRAPAGALCSSTTARWTSARAPRRSCRRCLPTRSACRCACVEQVMGDTDLTADAGKSSASRQTFVSGNAARGAGRGSAPQLLERLGFADRANEAVALAARAATASSGATARSARSTCARSTSADWRRMPAVTSRIGAGPLQSADHRRSIATGRACRTRPTVSRRRSPRSRSTSSSAR